MPGPSLQDAQQIGSNAGLRTQYGVILPPGARVVAYVRSTGIQSGDDAFLATNLVSTLAQGLARCRPNMGDFVVCLPGHAENVDAAGTAAFAANLVAGSRVIGVGRGANQPVFTWTVAAANWTIGVNDVLIAGLHLVTTIVGVNVTSAVTITGNDVALYSNDIETGSASSNTVNVVTVSGTAARYDISGNVFRGQGFGSTNGILVSSTGAQGRIADNEMLMAAQVAGQVINVTGVAVNLKILRNVINNFAPASVAAINLANVAITGQCSYNTITVFSTGASVSGTTGIAIGAAVTMGFFQNYVVNDPLTSGKLLPTVDT